MKKKISDNGCLHSFNATTMYAAYRISHPSEIDPIKEKMGAKKFYEYAIGIYKYFADMKRGEQFVVSKLVAQENIEKFIKIACLYAMDFPGYIQFNENFTIITKL